VKPYFETALGCLYNMDCLEFMKTMEDKSVDLVLTDPPYGVNFRSNFRTDKFSAIEGDSSVTIGAIDGFNRVLKNDCAIYIYTRWDVYDMWKQEIEKYFKIKNCIVWHKEGGGIGDLSGAYMFNHEFCIFAVKGRHILRGKRISDVWKLKKDNSSNYRHPTQKPVSTMFLPIEKSSDKGMLLFDPYIGSGTTAVACEKLGRKWIGIEISEKYCEIAARRISAEASQIKLF